MHPESIWFGVNFFISTIPVGVIISWICFKNRKSVIALIVFHFIINMSQEMLQIAQTTKCIQTVVLVMVAAVIVTYEKEMFLSKEHIPVKHTPLNIIKPLPHFSSD